MRKIIPVILIIGATLVLFTACGKEKKELTQKDLDKMDCNVERGEDYCRFLATETCPKGYTLGYGFISENESVYSCVKLISGGTFKEAMVCEEGWTELDDFCVGTKTFEIIVTTSCKSAAEAKNTAIKNGMHPTEANLTTFSSKKSGSTCTYTGSNKGGQLHWDEPVITSKSCPDGSKEIKGVCTETTGKIGRNICDEEGFIYNYQEKRCEKSDIKDIIYKCLDKRFTLNENTCEAWVTK